MRITRTLALIVFSLLLISLKACEDTTDTFTLSIDVYPPGAGQVEGEGRYEPGETVDLRAFAENDHHFFRWMKEEVMVGDKDHLLFTMPFNDVVLKAWFGLADGTPGGSVSDIDGNQYQTVHLGGLEFMAENLRTTRYRDGEEIPTGLSNQEWGNTSSGARDIYDHELIDGLDSPEEMVDAYGKLYNWFTVDNPAGLCPEGWEVPSQKQWTIVIDYLEEAYGLYNDEYSDEPGTLTGNVLKSCRQVGSPLGGEYDTEEHPRFDEDLYGMNHGVDLFGFGGLPAGWRDYEGNYVSLGHMTAWWASADYDEASAWYRLVYHDMGRLFNQYFRKEQGYSVRCVRILE